MADSAAAEAEAHAAAEAEPAPQEFEAAPPTADKPDVGVSRLEAELRTVEAERADYSRFWPWFTLTAGAAMTVGGTAVGVGKVFSCEDGCSTSAWIGIIVVTGTLVATLGTIWVVNADADVRDIESRRYQLQQEIERIRFSSKLPSAFDRQASAPLLSWTFALN